MLTVAFLFVLFSVSNAVNNVGGPLPEHQLCTIDLALNILKSKHPPKNP